MRLGLDIGSTTIKCVLIDEESHILFERYERHFSHIAEKAGALLDCLIKNYGDAPLSVAISGSAGMGLAESCGVPFIQEVFATRVAAGSFASDTDIIIELGGEDAKILFLTNGVEMRMNGSCAGGTGAFIDQMATLLKISPEELNLRAGQSEKVYTIASRCGVFAKTDVQALLNQGARSEDIAVSILHAVVNQTIAGLAQGRPIRGNVVYLGGPLTFMSELRAAFDDILHLTGTLPNHSLYFVSLGAALSAERDFTLGQLQETLLQERADKGFSHSAPLFEDKKDYGAFVERHEKAAVPVGTLTGFSGRAHLGIDAGSTTVKTALISEAGDLLHVSYQPNSGNPVPLVKAVLEEIYATCPDIFIESATTTGYGEQLLKAAFGCDYNIVETVAHFIAAKRFLPEVDFIIDIGGQDIKCFKIEKGAISDVFLNEACSSGCGSFLQTFAEALGRDIRDFAKLGLFGDAPVDLGSRCTVFMNSSVKQAQKDGAVIENISAGLAISVVKNALYKVIRASSPEELGKNVVVQGGTFYNDAVLRAFERELGAEVIRPSIAGLMGAYGAALYGMERAGKRRTPRRSTIMTNRELGDFVHEVRNTHCGLCTNNCALTVNSFAAGRRFISGNRCDRPLTKRGADNPLNIYDYKLQLLGAYKPVPGPRDKIGMPMVLGFYETLPFWHTLFTGLGFEVHTSPPSTRSLYLDGQATIPDDTVCYPAKLVHGHIRALADRDDIDTLFYPCMSYNIDEDISDNNYNCPVVAYYPEVVKANCGELEGKRFIYDYVGIHRPGDFVPRFAKILGAYWPDIRKREVSQAAEAAYREYERYLEKIRQRGAWIITQARNDAKPIILLAGRPYHLDTEVNHGIDKLITGHGAAVISEESVSHLVDKTPTSVLNQWTYHARLYNAASYCCENDDIHLVQLVSFGCGLDAVTTDEVRAILHRHDKLYTQIKIDEIENLGAVNIRLRCLFAALEQEEAS